MRDSRLRFLTRQGGEAAAQAGVGEEQDRQPVPAGGRREFAHPLASEEIRSPAPIAAAARRTRGCGPVADVRGRRPHCAHKTPTEGPFAAIASRSLQTVYVQLRARIRLEPAG